MPISTVIAKTSTALRASHFRSCPSNLVLAVASEDISSMRSRANGKSTSLRSMQGISCSSLTSGVRCCVVSGLPGSLSREMTTVSTITCPGHGTLNVEPSIGIAFEMQNQNDKLFAFPSNVFRQVQISVPGTYHDL